MNAGDPDAFAACFADGGIQMPPHFVSNTGKASIREWIHGVLSPFDCRFDFPVDELRVAADWAFERGRYTLALTPNAGGEPVRDTGKYITVYQCRPDGSWKIARDIWNSDLPLPGMR